MFDMKKVALLIAVTLGSFTVFAQNINKNELKQLQAFLAAPAEHATTNAEALKVTNLKDPSTWEGVTVENGHVTKIDWKNKKLAGDLKLDGFTALTSVDVSRNAITSVAVTKAPAVTEINASRNKATSVDFAGCPQLTKLSVNNNRLTEFSITDVPVIKTLNIASNNLVALDLAGSPTLQTVNC